MANLPKQVINDSIWNDRIKEWDRYYRQWEGRFQCDVLDQYYEGRQWKSQDTLQPKPYVINKVFETIQIKIANFIPTFPQFLVASKVGNEDDIEAAADSAHLKEDVLNTIIQDPEGNFADEIELCYKDSFFRFGIAEVGYEADWIWNPNVPRPLLGANVETNLTPDKARRIIDEPPELPVNERVYVKHIPAKTFRVGGIDHKYLNRCSWCGYYEWVDKNDLLALPKLMNRSKILSASFSAGSAGEPNRESPPDHGRNLLKVWKIWDLRAGLQLLIVDSPCTTVFQKKFKRLPLFDLRPDKRLVVAGFYPIPPAYHWISPQDEYNEIRDQLRNHRRRFIRKFAIMEGMIDDEEIEKFETGPDGALIKVRKENAIVPIENADLGNIIQETLATSQDDLDRISGTTGQERGVADRTTATQSNIINNRTALRETKERDRVVKWLCGVGREILLVVKHRFTGQILVRLTSPEGTEGFGQAIQAKNPVYRFVEHESINDDYDFRIDVDLTSMSSTAQVQEKQRMIEYLTVLTQFPMIAFSPFLVREAAYRIGYRNEKAIAEFQKMALLMELGRMKQLEAQAAPPQQGPPQNGPAGQQIAGQMAPPTVEQARNQMQNQLGQTQGAPQ